jgi:hypothetical protein
MNIPGNRRKIPGHRNNIYGIIPGNKSSNSSRSFSGDKPDNSSGNKTGTLSENENVALLNLNTNDCQSGILHRGDCLSNKKKCQQIKSTNCPKMQLAKQSSSSAAVASWGLCRQDDAIVGNFHQGDPNLFDVDSVGKQCTCNAIVALCELPNLYFRFN